jgi:hypothetical protein
MWKPFLILQLKINLPLDSYNTKPLPNQVHSKFLYFTVGIKRANKSGPCRDRTDDPQIKSVSEEDDSKPD